MSIKIHPTAIIEGDVHLEEGVEIGPYTIIKGKIRIGRNTYIGSRVTIIHNVEIGENCEIHDGCIIGGPPQHLRDKGEKGKVIIGNNSILREYVTVNRGTDFDKQKTVIGNKVFIMAYCHIAHDCEVGDNVVMANAATLGGHVVVEPHAVLGGLSAVQQKCRIGAYAMLGGLSGANKDIPPYTIAVGTHAELQGINLRGLRKKGFSKEDIHMIRKVYELIFRTPNKTKEELISEAEHLYGHNSKVKYFLDFLKKSLKTPHGFAIEKLKPPIKTYKMSLRKPRSSEQG